MQGAKKQLTAIHKKVPVHKKLWI